MRVVRPGNEYCPSAAVIAAECAEIQKEWTPAEQLRRMGRRWNYQPPESGQGSYRLAVDVGEAD